MGVKNPIVCVLEQHLFTVYNQGLDFKTASGIEKLLNRCKLAVESTWVDNDLQDRFTVKINPTPALKEAHVVEQRSAYREMIGIVVNMTNLDPRTVSVSFENS